MDGMLMDNGRYADSYGRCPGIGRLRLELAELGPVTGAADRFRVLAYLAITLDEGGLCVPEWLIRAVDMARVEMRKGVAC
jgi:hypothetical protein